MFAFKLFQQFWIFSGIELIREIGTDFNHFIRRAPGQWFFGHPLSSGFLGPVTSRGSWNIVLFTNLGKADIGQAVLFGQPSHGRLPHSLVKFQPADCFCILAHENPLMPRPRAACFTGCCTPITVALCQFCQIVGNIKPRLAALLAENVHPI